MNNCKSIKINSVDSTLPSSSSSSSSLLIHQSPLTVLNNNNIFSNYIYVEDFLIYNKHSSNLNIFYLISLDLIQLKHDQLNICKNDTRFFEIESLDVNVHYAKHTAISYCAKFGHGYKMPYICHYRTST